MALVAFVMLTVMLAGGALAASRAPAVTFALFAAVTWGFIGYAVGIVDGRRGVPADVASWASAALAIGGIVGLVGTRARGSRTALRRAAGLVAATGPLASVALLFLLQEACPLYVTARAGFCYYEVDVLGGWSAQVAALFMVDTIVIAFLLLLSARQGPERDA